MLWLAEDNHVHWLWRHDMSHSRDFCRTLRDFWITFCNKSFFVFFSSPLDSTFFNIWDLVIYHSILRRLLLSIPLMSMVVVTYLRRLRSFPQIWQLSDHPIRFHLRRLSLLEPSDVILELLALCQTDSSHATDRVDDRPQKQETIRIKTKVCVLAIMIQ